MPLTADVYQAIADPTRRRILDLLAERERPVTELAAPFAMSRPAVSQHLRVLLQAGLVSERRAGRRRLYRLRPAPLQDVDGWLSTYRKFWRSRLDALGEYLDTERENEP
jgi:DNA-binding transcriptional ArsR family regulator